MPRPVRTVLPRLFVRSLLSTLMLTGLLLVPTTAHAATSSATDRHRPAHPGRTLVHYRVRPGDTATVIATRLHAWTAELLRINHRSPGDVWRVGERVVVPVVAERAHRASSTGTTSSARATRASKTQVRDEVGAGRPRSRHGQPDGPGPSRGRSRAGSSTCTPRWEPSARCR